MQYGRLISTRIRLSQPPPQVGYRGSLEASNLRMSFSISKSISWSTNTATFRIYNLSADSRNQLAYYGDEIRIFAGYQENGGEQLLFIGNTTQVSHAFEFPDIITTLIVGDGERVLNRVLVSVSFGENTPARTIINSVAEQMGLTIQDFAQTENLNYALGYKDIDYAKNVLDTVCKKLDLVWSVQNNNLVILKLNRGNEVKPIIEINADTGMIGVPQRYTDKRQYDYAALPPQGAPNPGWRVRCLLRPEIIPGDRIRLRSAHANVDGLFYVQTITHDGDNFGPNFESNLEVIAI